MYCALKDIIRNETIYVDITETDSYSWIGTQMNSPFETFFTFDRYDLQYELDPNEWRELEMRQYNLYQDKLGKIEALVQNCS